METSLSQHDSDGQLKCLQQAAGEHSVGSPTHMKSPPLTGIAIDVGTSDSVKTRKEESARLSATHRAEAGERSGSRGGEQDDSSSPHRLQVRPAKQGWKSQTAAPLDDDISAETLRRKRAQVGAIQRVAQAEALAQALPVAQAEEQERGATARRKRAQVGVVRRAAEAEMEGRGDEGQGRRKQTRASSLRRDTEADDGGDGEERSEEAGGGEDGAEGVAEVPYHGPARRRAAARANTRGDRVYE